MLHLKEREIFTKKLAETEIDIMILITKRKKNKIGLEVLNLEDHDGILWLVSTESDFFKEKNTRGVSYVELPIKKKPKKIFNMKVKCMVYKTSARSLTSTKINSK